ncbi:hypothetical protein EGW08_013075, partial [Elysia chlorotica]
LLCLHVYILRPKANPKDRPKNSRRSQFLTSTQQLKTTKPYVPVARVGPKDQGKGDGKHVVFQAGTRSLWHQTRQRGPSRKYHQEPGIPYRLGTLGQPYRASNKITRLLESSEDEASTLNEVTWSNEPSSLQFNVPGFKSELGLPPRARWLVDKLSDVAEETEQTASQWQDEGAGDGGTSTSLKTLPQIDPCGEETSRGEFEERDGDRQTARRDDREHETDGDKGEERRLLFETKSSAFGKHRSGKPENAGEKASEDGKKKH